MKLFFDLDGTILEAKPRLYLLFQHLVPTSQLTFEEYWALKQNKVNHFQILTSKFNYTEQQFEQFESEWMRLIENEEWLRFDKPFEGTVEKLQQLSRSHELYIVTARQSGEAALNQINQYGIATLIVELLVTEQKLAKDELIIPYHPTPNDWIIGDTGNDIFTGKQLGIRTAAVSSGFLSKTHLANYQPEVLLDNVNQLDFEKYGDIN